MEKPLAQNTSSSSGTPESRTYDTEGQSGRLEDYLKNLPKEEITSIHNGADEEANALGRLTLGKIEDQELRIIELEGHVEELTAASKEKDSVLCDILGLLNDEEDNRTPLIGEVRLSDIRDGKTNLASALLTFVEGQLAKEEELYEALAEAESLKNQSRVPEQLPPPEFIHPPIHDIMRNLGALTKTNLDANQSRYAHGIIERLKDLVAALICEPKLAKSANDHLPSFQRRAFDVARLCQIIEEELSLETTEAAVTLEIQLDSDLPTAVYGDEKQLHAIITNLIRHRIQNTTGGSMNLKVYPDGRLIGFELNDYGSGITAEEISEILKDGKTGNSQHQLANCRRIIEQMGGRMMAHAVVGRGTTFHFELPMRQSSPIRAELPSLDKSGAPTSESFPQALPGSVLKVLIVEDNPTNRFVASKTVEHLGHNVVTASNGAEAIETLQHHIFDVVFMDLDMPVMNGIEAAKNIRGLTTAARNTTIFALTGNRFSEIKEECSAAGMDGFISKPFEVNEIQSALDSVQVA